VAAGLCDHRQTAEGLAAGEVVDIFEIAGNRLRGRENYGAKTDARSNALGELVGAAVIHILVASNGCNAATPNLAIPGEEPGSVLPAALRPGVGIGEARSLGGSRAGSSAESPPCQRLRARGSGETLHLRPAVGSGAWKSSLGNES
jgi:hypothetical protein